MSQKLTTEEFIKKAREVHGDKYNYSKVEYVNSTTKVCIICPKHGEFWQRPNLHLQKKGCPKCGRARIATSSSKSPEQFLQDAKKIHGTKYDYSKTEYVNWQTKVVIICPIHGEFSQSPSSHIHGNGCPKCGKEMKRTPEVIDCWFDSGAMPFAQYHYPFENKKLFKEQFPADFISEGIDQTRGWFYSLLVISVFVTGQTPYKNVLVNDLLLDKNGQKMHKSRGNAISPFEIMEEYGADTVRFYMLYASPVWTPLKFDVDGLKEIYSKYISTFKNAYSFFEMYANADHIDPREYNIPIKDRE